MKLFKLFSVFACVTAINGCGISDDTYTKWDDWSGGRIVTIVDDSLALLRSVRIKKECYEVGGIDGHWEKCERQEGHRHTGLFLVNYREKKEPLWGDTSGIFFNIVHGYYNDSAIMLIDSNKFGFWKIGEQPSDLKLLIWNEPCGYSNRIMATPWFDGNVLIRGAENCPFAVLDTSSGIAANETFTQKMSWINDCKYINFVKGNIVCLHKNSETKKITMSVDGVETDSVGIQTDSIKAHFGLYVQGNDSVHYDKIHKINIDLKQVDSAYEDLWLASGTMFMNSKFPNYGIGIQYNCEELLGVMK
jgi:hypothetical protein